MDSGSIGNYFSAPCQAALGIEVYPKHDFEQLTLADGSIVHVQGYVQFNLVCGGYKSNMIAWVFHTLHWELILGILWLVNENPTIDWATSKVTMEKNDETFTLPCYSRYLNKSSEEQEKSEVQFIRTKVFERWIQQQKVGDDKEEDRAFLGIVRNAVDRTRALQIGGPTNVEILKRPDLPLKFGRS